jgi:hypothetical protein
MKVMAIATGFFDHMRRREGDVFSIPATPAKKANEEQAAKLGVKKGDSIPSAFSARWMQPVASSTPDRVSTAQQALNKKQDELKGAGQAAAGTDTATGDAAVI